MAIEEHVVICIPTKRKPPLRTLESYATAPFTVIIIADPEVVNDHRSYYPGRSDIVVCEGYPGLSRQVAVCYRRAATRGYPFWFRLDDDLAPSTFLHKEGYTPNLTEVITTAHECLLQTQTTLVGFHNGANRHWMKDGFARTYGLVHGGANLSVTTLEPEKYINPEVTRAEDVWRTCAHREECDGKVGRVQFIGFDKSKSTAIAGNSVASASTSQEAINRSRDLILARFPTMVTCQGMRPIFGGKHMIPNWRMRRG